MSVSLQEHASVWPQYRAIKDETPTKYARDIATEIGISEAQLTWSRVGHDAARLQSDMRAILAGLEAVGTTRCICRNTWAVHEQTGSFTHQQIGAHVGLVLNPRALDLRLFVEQWDSVFYLNERSERGERQSIQFFDRQGDAILKVYATDKTDMTAWQALLSRFASAANPPLTIKPADIDTHAAAVDAAALEQAWREMTNVHQFFGILKKHRVSRQQAFRLVNDDLACRVSNDSLSHLLERLLQAGNEFMIFVGNRGCVQIFTGTLEKLTPMRGWLNIFNRDFTLHLLEAGIAESWVTRKPTEDGHVTSLELFAEDGTQIAQLYGQRTEGQPEQPQWRAQLDALAAERKTV